MQHALFIGQDLRRLVQAEARLPKRDAFSLVSSYLANQVGQKKIAVLYGLERTGKTTLMKQLIASLGDEDFSHAAYILCSSRLDMWTLEDRLKELFEKGFRFFFLDEITEVEDFIDEAKYLATAFTELGTKIVLAGRHSLDLWFVQRYKAYGRCELVPMTFISYAEWSRIAFEMGCERPSIRDYLRKAGSLEALANSDPIWSDYISSAVAKNIQHALTRYEDGKSLYTLYDLEHENKLELGVENMLSVQAWFDLYQAFKALLALSKEDKIAGAIHKISDKRAVFLDHQRVNKEFTSSHICNNIREIIETFGFQKEERSELIDQMEAAVREKLDVALGRYNITQTQIDDIFDYLKCMQFALSYQKKIIWEGDTKHFRGELDGTLLGRRKNIERTNAYALTFLQPSLRLTALQAAYSEICALLARFSDCPEKKEFLKRLEGGILGDVLEETIYTETVLAFSPKRGIHTLSVPERYEIFKLYFLPETDGSDYLGEYDLVIRDRQDELCVLYEVKSRDEGVKQTDYKHLTNESLLSEVESRFGRIAGRVLLYGGKTSVNKTERIVDRNIEEYLIALHNDPVHTALLEPEKLCNGSELSSL